MNLVDIGSKVPSREDLLAVLPLGGRPTPFETAIRTGGILVAGMLLGTGISLLFAPMNGAELRAAIRRLFTIDPNERFHRELDNAGGLPGPIKHLAP
jgi:hypothetical protein